MTDPSDCVHPDYIRLTAVLHQSYLLAFPKDEFSSAESTVYLLLADLLATRCELTRLRLEKERDAKRCVEIALSQAEYEGFGGYAANESRRSEAACEDIAEAIRREFGLKV